MLRAIGGDPITEREVLASLLAGVSGEASSSCDSVCLTGLKITTGLDSLVAIEVRSQLDYMRAGCDCSSLGNLELAVVESSRKGNPGQIQCCEFESNWMDDCG